MSSILKALEKVEESRSTRRNPGTSGLVRARERRPAWIMPAGVLGGAAVAALVTFAAMGGFSRTPAPPRDLKAAANPVSLVAPPLHPMAKAPAAKPELTRRVKPAASLAASSGSGKASPAHAPAPDLPLPISAATSPAQAAAAKKTPVPAAARLQPAAEKTRPEIKVTGIAWQKDAESSAAIVNGRPVQQGGMVDGFKVEEIFQDKVRFSSDKGTLDVPLAGGE